MTDLLSLPPETRILESSGHQESDKIPFECPSFNSLSGS